MALPSAGLSAHTPAGLMLVAGIRANPLGLFYIVKDIASQR
jgi:hypothetical protein